MIKRMKLIVGILAGVAVTTTALGQLRYATYVDDTTALVALNPSAAGGVVVVKEMASGTTDDGALFYYSSGSAAATNTTTVFATSTGTGRWLRAVSAGGSGDSSWTNYTYRVEQFGAVADDGIDDYDAITNALTTFGTAVLGEGRYDVSTYISLTSNQQLIGSGKDKTILRLIDDCPDYDALTDNAEQKFNVVRSDPYAGYTNILVSNMTIDANHGGQSSGNYTNTMNVVGLHGHGNTIQGIKAIGWGAGGDSATVYSECFPLLIGDWASTNVTEGLISQIVDCDVTGPSYDYASDGANNGGDVTAIALTAFYGAGQIKGNTLHDVGLSDTPGEGWSPGGNLLGITGYGNDVAVTENYIKDWYGVGLWIGDSWTNSNISYTHNTLDGVKIGAMLYKLSAVSTANFTDVTVANNIINTYGDVPSGWRFANDAETVLSSSVQTAVAILGNTRATNVLFSDNALNGGQFSRGSTNYATWPSVIVDLDADAYVADLTLVNNQIDCDGISNRILWLNDASSLNNTKIVAANNRDKDGYTVQIKDQLTAGGGTTAAIDYTHLLTQRDGSYVATPPADSHLLFYDSDDDILKVKRDTGGTSQVIVTTDSTNVYLPGRLNVQNNNWIRASNGDLKLSSQDTNSIMAFELGQSGNYHAILDQNATNTWFRVHSPQYVSGDDTDQYLQVISREDGGAITSGKGKLYVGGSSSTVQVSGTLDGNTTGTITNVAGIGVAAQSGYVGPLIRATVGGADKWYADNYGITYQIASRSSGYMAVYDGLLIGSTAQYYIDRDGSRMLPGADISWVSGTDAFSGTRDLRLYRDSAATLAQRNGTNAQTSRIYGSYTDASNYSRISVSHDGSGTGTIALETAGTGADDQSLKLQVAANGALYVENPTYTAGNARGAGAVDLQISRSAASHVASGTLSGIIAGAANTATGQKSVVAGGDTGTASGNWSFIGAGVASTASGNPSSVIASWGSTASAAYTSALGSYYANAYLYGQHAYASGRFAATGDAQGSRLVARNTTSGTTPADLFLDGVDDRLVLPANTSWGFTISVVGRTTDAGTGAEQSAYYKLEGLIKRDGANNTTLVGTVTKTVLAEDDATWDVTVSADDTNEALDIAVTGGTGDNTRWVATITLTEVGG